MSINVLSGNMLGEIGGDIDWQLGAARAAAGAMLSHGPGLLSYMRNEWPVMRWYATDHGLTRPTSEESIADLRRQYPRYPDPMDQSWLRTMHYRRYARRLRAWRTGKRRIDLLRRDLRARWAHHARSGVRKLAKTTAKAFILGQIRSQINKAIRPRSRVSRSQYRPRKARPQVTLAQRVRQSVYRRRKNLQKKARKRKTSRRR